jgi:hypothetical protein
MKCKDFQIIDGVKVVLSVRECNIDPQETKSAIAKSLRISIEETTLLHNFSELYYEYAVPLLPGDTTIVVSDEDGALTEKKLASLKKHERLTIEDVVILDWKGTQYHIKTGSIWKKEEIATIGKALPKGAILPDNLTQSQQSEIANQREVERIASLTLEQRAAEKKARLEATADETDRLSRRAQIQGINFDVATYYAEKRMEIEAKYA